jgi:hypothetical protein
MIATMHGIGVKFLLRLTLGFALELACGRLLVTLLGLRFIACIEKTFSPSVAPG